MSTERDIADKNHIIQKLKRDNEHLTERRNQLIGEKAELISAIQKLLRASPNPPLCSVFHHSHGDDHSVSEECPPEIRYSEARENAKNLVQKFTYKSKS